MSTVSDVVSVVEKWPDAQRNELLMRLLKIPSAATAGTTYVTRPRPLGLRTDKLASDLLAEIEDEGFLQSSRQG